MNRRTALGAFGALAIAWAVFMILDMTWVRAHLGGVNSQLQLAWAYGTGEGVEIDQEKASDWYRKAAEQGDARGQLVLAARFDQGQGLPVDATAATQWYKRSAASGNAVAQLAMAVRTHEGKGAVKDDVRAAMWLILAHRTATVRPDGDDQQSAATRATLLEVLRASLTEEQLADARRLAADWRAVHPGALPAPVGELPEQARVDAP